jgi:hypothetical protein
MPYLAHSRTLTKRTIYALLVIAGLNLAALLAGTRSQLLRGPNLALLPTVQAAQETVTTAQNQQPTERVQVEVITIRSTGFEPREITRPAGRVLLAVNNSSGFNEVLVRLVRADGALLHEVRISRKGRNWRQPLDLIPGNYVLTGANHPNWVCHITITN